MRRESVAPSGGGRVGHFRVDPHRLFDKGKCEGEVVDPLDSDRDPVGGGAPSSNPFVEGALGQSLFDPFSCQPNVQALIPMKVSDLSLPGEVGVSVPPSRRATDQPGNLHKFPFELVSNRHRAQLMAAPLLQGVGAGLHVSRATHPSMTRGSTSIAAYAALGSIFRCSSRRG